MFPLVSIFTGFGYHLEENHHEELHEKYPFAVRVNIKNPSPSVQGCAKDKFCSIHDASIVFIFPLWCPFIVKLYIDAVFINDVPEICPSCVFSKLKLQRSIFIFGLHVAIILDSPRLLQTTPFTSV